MQWVDLVLGVLCAFRLTQLVVWDAISEPMTSWLADQHPKLDELLSCAHCVGFWCSALTVVALHFQEYHWSIRLSVRAFALAGGLSMIQHGTKWLERPVAFWHGDIEMDEGSLI